MAPIKDLSEQELLCRGRNRHPFDPDPFTPEQLGVTVPSYGVPEVLRCLSCHKIRVRTYHRWTGKILYQRYIESPINVKLKGVTREEIRLAYVNMLARQNRNHKGGK